MSQCPCGSMMDYLACCGMYLSGKVTPQTPEALMRSRYTAYTNAMIDYIKKTMKGKALLGFNEVQAKQWASSVQWIGLNVIGTHRDKTDEHIGFVEFMATYSDKGVIETIHEISQFQWIEGAWFYIDGVHPSKIMPKKMSRNALCPCGSRKKYKHCHAKSG